MIAAELATATAVFGFAFWLGAYLIRRDARNIVLRRAGSGMMAYALVWAWDTVARVTPDRMLPALLEDLRWPIQFLPALLWAGALIALVPETVPLRGPVYQIWRFGFLAYAIVAGILVRGGFTVKDQYGPASVLFSVLVLVPLLLAALLLWRVAPAIRPRRAGGVLLVAALFFTLSTTLLLFSPGWLPHIGVLLLVGVDLLFLGVTIAVLDAFDLGETLIPDMVASFDGALLSALIFGGQVTLVMALATGATRPLAALLLATVATAIAASVFADPLRAAADQLAFARFPRIRQARADLRAVASALPRIDASLDFDALDEAEFARLTRRALSHFGDLPRLSANPLTRLPLVAYRLTARNASDDSLERAAELKALLAESIARLKPRTGPEFGTSDEWRYYNALYFPYVVGLKPYGRRAMMDHPDPVAHAALEWFGTVPERTLYNWQTAAARLVAQDLRTRNAATRD